MAKRKHWLTMRQSAAWRLYLGLACLFAGAWIFEQSVFEQPKTPSAVQHPLTATLLVIVGLALIWGWWTIKRRLERIIERGCSQEQSSEGAVSVN
jgi:protein-S-isoprenylcysteine O-methyltransferase Ste14